MKDNPSDSTIMAIDYPFLSDEERAFVASFLQAEGRYPVLYIAYRYLQRSANKVVQVFARANGVVGEHRRMCDVGLECGISRERVRQVRLSNITKEYDAGEVWNESRWQPLGFLHQPVLTAAKVHWDELRQKEQLDGLDFFAALYIIRQMSPCNIIGLRTDGRRANARMANKEPWQMPEILFAYDSRQEKFPFESVLSILGHEASLQRIADKRMSLSELVGQYFTEQHSDEDEEAVIAMMREILTLFPHVEIENDDIVFRANRTNYIGDIYQILRRNGQAMTVDAIYEEFRLLHPDDPHTDSSFIRNYMLRDDRFESVGWKSTYQLREWERFSGALGDLAVHLMEDRDEPLKADALCRMMVEHRPTTTLKSCSTSIYIAVSACRLLFYVDAEAADRERAEGADAETSRYYVGLFNRQYPERFWASPITVEGAVRSMRRFLQENARWPFASRKTGVEPTLYHALKKYKLKRCVTDDEYLRYHQGLEDINPDDFPANGPDLQFQNRCQELMDYCEKRHHLPTSGRLLSWYQASCTQQEQFSNFRKNLFQRLQAVIASSRKALPPVVPISSSPHSAEQLSLEFED